VLRALGVRLERDEPRALLGELRLQRGDRVRVRVRVRVGLG